MNVYGYIVMNEMAVAAGKVTRLVLNRNETAGKPSSPFNFGGSEWGSNPPVTGLPAARRF
jgi:hypothetical protein